MTDVTAVPHLDLNRYLGRWYEVCRLPMEWEDETATDITTHYTRTEDGKIKVDNRCFDAEGQPQQAVGEVAPVDETNARVRVSFLPGLLRWLPFTNGDYWVLKVDPEYRTALVGTPDREHLWVLHRDPHVPDERLLEYVAEAERQGFDIDRLITPRHTGREVTDDMLAKD